MEKEKILKKCKNFKSENKLLEAYSNFSLFLYFSSIFNNSSKAKPFS